MSHTKSIIISGMTCQNCVNKVSQAFLNTNPVLMADIHLAPAKSTVKSTRDLTDQEIEDVLKSAGNYAIQKDQSLDKKKSVFAAYRPLIVAFCLLLVCTATLTFTFDKGLDFAMHVFMGGFFLLFSFLKLIDINGFADSYESYDLLAMRSRSYAYVYPFLELGLGLAYINFWNPQVTYLTTILLMGFSSIGVIRSVLKKQEIKCACMGSMFDLKMSTVTIVEDVLMVMMATFMFLN